MHVSTVYMPLVRTPMIEPTDLYRRFPALSPEEAAGLIVQAIVERRKRVSTGFGRFSEVTYATAPMIQDAIVNTGYKLFPDSRAARGGAKDEASPEAKELTAEQKALERATRGTHW